MVLRGQCPDLCSWQWPRACEQKSMLTFYWLQNVPCQLWQGTFFYRVMAIASESRRERKALNVSKMSIKAISELLTWVSMELDETDGLTSCPCNSPETPEICRNIDIWRLSICDAAGLTFPVVSWNGICSQCLDSGITPPGTFHMSTACWTV